MPGADPASLFTQISLFTQPSTTGNVTELAAFALWNHTVRIRIGVMASTSWAACSGTRGSSPVSWRTRFSR